MPCRDQSTGSVREHVGEAGEPVRIRLEVGGRLVQRDEGRLADQGRGDDETLALASGQREGVAPLQAGQADLRQGDIIRAVGNRHVAADQRELEAAFKEHGGKVCCVYVELAVNSCGGHPVSLGNLRLGFVCTALTTDGQHGLSGYFMEYDRELAPEERLQFCPGELPPPFDPDAAPKLPAADWPAERLAKAERNYAMEYVRSGLLRLAEIFGPAEAAHLGRVTGRLVGAQLYSETARRVARNGSPPT